MNFSGSDERPREAARVDPLEPRRLLAVVAPSVIDARLGYREAPGQGTTRAHVWWTDNNTTETGYRVEWSMDGSANWQVLTDLPANASSASQELNAAQKYHYRVRAIEGANVSAPSVVVSPMTGMDRVVQVTASPVGNTMRLAWPLDPEAVSYQVWRKQRHESSWQPRTPSPLPATSTGFVDWQLPGQAYEYQVARVTRRFDGSSQGTAYGYVYAGNAAALSELRGRALLVIDQTQSAALSSELARYRQDLVADGWEVLNLIVPRDDGNAHQAKSVKASIQNIARSISGGIQSIVLIGHVPVPYSGTNAWDGHSDHVGAWPADGYYGESIGLWTGGNWTDTATAANPGSSDNNNQPGDGKFDNDTLPAPITVPVGRIDFANLPGMRWSFSPLPATVAESETLLLKRYFEKNHAWRIRAVGVAPVAIEDDHLGGGDGENGWRNFAPLVGASSSYALDWSALCLNGVNYLWSAGFGPGSNGSAENVVGVTQLHAPDVRVSVAFSLLGGSYFGDWNKESNLLREIVAANGISLAAMWSGTPNSFMHTMGLGETIGQAAMLTQNNTLWGPYSPPSVGSRGTHQGLMGDPTLTMSIVAPVTNGAAHSRPSGNVVTWNAANDTSVVGYYIYRAPNPDGPFTRISHATVAGTSFTDTSMPNSLHRYHYMVRTVKLQTTPSGTCYNASAGVVAQLDRPVVPLGEEHSHTPIHPASRPTSTSNDHSHFTALFSTDSIDASKDPHEDILNA